MRNNINEMHVNVLLSLFKPDLRYMHAILIDTNIVSYIAVEHNPKDTAENAISRRLSKQWWDLAIQAYLIIISKTVWVELSDGKIQENVRKRQELVKDMDRLRVDYKVIRLAAELLFNKVFRRTARNDAIIFATCCIHGVGHLVTWNMKDLADNKNEEEMIRIVRKYTYFIPEIITPEDFLTNRLGVTDLDIPVKRKKIIN